MTPFEAGQLDTLKSLGIVKEAFSIPPWLRTAGRNFKEGFIGSPGKFLKELRQGKAFKREGMIAEGFKPRGAIEAGLFYGIPSYQGYSIMKSNDSDKAQQLGGMATSNLAMLGAYRPFGMLGGILAAPFADRLGRGAVTIGQKLTGTYGTKSQNPYYDYQQQQFQR